MTNKEKKTLIGNKIFVEAKVNGQLVLCALTRFEYLQMKLLALKNGEIEVLKRACLNPKQESEIEALLKEVEAVLD